MIDPFTAFAAVKSAVSAGRELVNVTKQIGEFFDGVDDLRAAHEKKKNSCIKCFLASEQRKKLISCARHPMKNNSTSRLMTELIGKPTR